MNHQTSQESAQHEREEQKDQPTQAGENPPGDAFRLHLHHWLSWVSSLLSLAHIADLDMLVSIIT